MAQDVPYVPIDGIRGFRVMGSSGSLAWFVPEEDTFLFLSFWHQITFLGDRMGDVWIGRGDKKKNKDWEVYN